MTSIPNMAVLAELLRAQRELEAAQFDLTERCRNGYAHTVRLARQYGMEWADIARHLNTTPEAARKRYQRGA